MNTILPYFILILLPWTTALACKQRPSDANTKAVFSKEQPQGQFIGCFESREECPTGIANTKRDETYCPRENIRGPWACFANGENTVKPSPDKYESIGCMSKFDCNAQTCGQRAFLSIPDEEACASFPPAYRFVCYCEKT